MSSSRLIVDCPIPSAFLAAIAALSNLQQLNLWDNQITEIPDARSPDV